MGVSVRHNSRLAALVAFVAAVMTVAWFSRALQTGSLLDWFWCVLVAGVGVLQLLVVRDGRAPLMVADEHGVRVRRGETWSGLRWQDVEHVEVQSPASWLRDGRLVVHPRVAEGTESYAVPLARTTKIEYDGLTGDLVADLDALASGRVPVLVLTRIEPETEDRSEKPTRSDRAVILGARVGRLAAVFGRSGDGATDEVESPAGSEPLEGDRSALASDPATESSPAPGPAPVPEGNDEQTEHREDTEEETEYEPVDPARETLPAARSEVLRDSVRMLPPPVAIPTQRNGEAPIVVAHVDDLAPSQTHPVPDALIGPLVAAARKRSRLSIDTLSERTRIRPHVLESIEVDDFEACGGDFYARGHLRTLARVFGLDAQQLLDLYDDHYAKAEIEARQVFEAELASGIGGGVRAAHTGPRWSLLAACVLALAGVWGVARVFSDTPQELVSPAPGVVDSAGLARATPAGVPKPSLAPLQVSASGASPQVVIRDRDGRILWAGKLAQGRRQQVIGMAPFDVTASNGAAVRVSYLGRPRGTVGDSTAASSRHFG